MNSGCLALFALPFAAVGVGMGFWLFSTLSRSYESRSWVETPARILSAELRESRGDDSTTYACEARYAYTFAGRDYESTRVSFYAGSDNIGSFQRDAYRELARYVTKPAPKDATPALELDPDAKGGPMFRCYVNPQQPDQAVLYRTVRVPMVLFQSLFALIFGGVGFGLMAGSFAGARSLRKKGLLQFRYPGEPWKWREDWAAGVVRADRKGAVFIACFAGFWNVISFPIAFLAVSQAVKNHQYGIFFVLLFPLIGVLLAWWAVHEILVTIRFGKSVLQLGAVPGVIGGKLAGIVQLPEKLRTEDGFHLTLKCSKTVTTGSGKKRSTSEQEIWSAEQDIAVDATRDPTRSVIPVLFAIPFDLPGSDPLAPQPVTWKLEAKAKNPGVDLSIAFIVPVFKTAASSPDFKLDDQAIRPFLAGT